MLSQYGKDFIKILHNLKPSKNAYEVFSDWLIMTAATLYAWKKDENVEKEFEEIAKQYTKEEIQKHAQLLAITVNALEEKIHDFLGEVFTFAELSNNKKGQFFTPYHISFMMAKMMIENEKPKQRVFQINDPTCGAGGMLVACIQVLKEQEFPFQQEAIFIGQDIDPRCARMAFIQLSLLAAPAIIICGNTLTMETYWKRETIGYHMAGMEFRLKIEAMLSIIENPEKAMSAQIEEKPIGIKEPRIEMIQGELF